MDRYTCFAQLTQHETHGVDYRILMRKGASNLAVMAPHGGGIEFGTAAIAKAIAHPDHTFWAFCGTKKTGNRILHLTSTRFDVPDALKVSTGAQTVVTIHGCSGETLAVYVGGRHRKLKSQICHALTRAGFNAQMSTKSGLRGENPANLCNRCMSGSGVQLEITEGLRKMMFTCHEARGIRGKAKSFFHFTSAVKNALVN